MLVLPYAGAFGTKNPDKAGCVEYRRLDSAAVRDAALAPCKALCHDTMGRPAAFAKILSASRFSACSSWLNNTTTGAINHSGSDSISDEERTLY